MADFQLSEFQKKKLLRVFTTFFDINKDGVIEWEDFEIAIEKIRTLHSWDAGSEKHTNAKETLSLIWEGLKKFADQNQDDKITQAEWFKIWSECIQACNDQSEMPEWCKKYMTFMFDVNDTSGDQQIDIDEYTTVYTSYGLQKEECEIAFKKFADNGMVDKELFYKLWTEYFVSTDPTAKGNFLFGEV